MEWRADLAPRIMQLIYPEGYRSMRLDSTIHRLAAAVCFIALFIAGGCSINPATGERHLNFIGEDQEIAMGQQSDQEIVASMGVYQDPALQKYVQDLGMKLAMRSERPNLPWKFTVIDDPVVNAFAIPGGFIYVTRGILTHLTSEAELAGVIGHEIGHVTAKHSVNRMATQQIAQIGLGVGIALKPELQQYADLAGQGLQILFLKFSRDDESQADALGVRYMNRIGDNPHQLEKVMTMLDQVTQAAGGGSTPEWMQTHPAPANRREAIMAEIDTIRSSPVGSGVNADGYLRKIDGLPFGENPREGFFKGNSFYQPTMKFRFDFPDGWKTQNQKSSVVAVSPAQDGMIQISVAKEKTAAEAAKTFAGQQGMTSAVSNIGAVHGFTTTANSFSSTTDQGSVEGLATFVEYGGTVYQILAYASKASWSTYQPVATQAVKSFDKVTDASILSVKPNRVKVITLDRSMTIDDFNKRYPSVIPVDQLAMINQAERTTVFKSGQMLKQVLAQ
jgi:predicted Zn-dependent protease